MFTITPDETQTYHATVIERGHKHDIELPKALRIGFALSVTQLDSTIVAAIACNRAALFNYAGQQLVVTARHGGKIYYQDRILVSAEAILVQIPNRDMPDGIVSVTVYDEHKIPLCERLVYVRHPGRAAQLAITTDKAVYHSKEKTSVKIKTSAGANLSVAVVDAGIIPVSQESIQAYLMLKSEVRGKIEHAERYFDTTNVNRF